MKNDIESILVSENEIDERVSELAEQITIRSYLNASSTHSAISSLQISEMATFSPFASSISASFFAALAVFP